MKTVYIAYDGTRFDDAEECKSYERKKNRERGNKDIRGLDSNDQPVYYNDIYFLQMVKTVACLTGDAAEAFYERCQDEGFPYEGIRGMGVYLWDYGRNDWVSVNSLIVEYQKKIDDLRQLVAEITEK